SPDMQAQLGKPYQSSQGRPGGGLGLFLAVNEARTLGGALTAKNRTEGGAIGRLTLPLSAIALAGGTHGRLMSAADRRGRRGFRPYARALVRAARLSRAACIKLRRGGGAAAQSYAFARRGRSQAQRAYFRLGLRTDAACARCRHADRGPDRLC